MANLNILLYDLCYAIIQHTNEYLHHKLLEPR